MRLKCVLATKKVSRQTGWFSEESVEVPVEGLTLGKEYEAETISFVDDEEQLAVRFFLLNDNNTWTTYRSKHFVPANR